MNIKKHACVTFAWSHTERWSHSWYNLSEAQLVRFGFVEKIPTLEVPSQQVFIDDRFHEVGGGEEGETDVTHQLGDMLLSVLNIVLQPLHTSCNQKHMY